MEQVERAAACIGELGRRLGQPSLALDAHGRLDVVLDGGVHLGLRLDAAAGVMELESQIFESPGILPTSLLRTMLEADFLWDGTAGATLAMGDGVIQLLRRVPLDGIDAGGFCALVESFLDVAEHYGRACRQAAVAPGTGTPAAIDPQLMIIRG